MSGRIISFFAITAFCFFGCRQNIRSVSTGGFRVDTPDGMIEYLQKQRLPALKSAEIWQNNYGPGLKLTTEHYQIYSTLLAPLMLSQIPGFIESAYRGYNRQLAEPVETSGRFTVYLFATRQQWEAFTMAFAGDAAPIYCRIKAGAYYLNGSCIAYNIGRERTFSVIGHEGWHQFNSRHFRYRLPSWLDEGIAMLFEVSRYDEGLFYFEPSRNLHRLGELKKTLIKNKMIPLKELVGLNPGEVLAGSERDLIAAFYAQSYALVRFLREENYGERLGNFHQMLAGGLRGRWPLNGPMQKIAADRNIPLTVGWNRVVGKKLFEEYIDDDFDMLEKEYVIFCRKIVYPVRLR